MEAENVFDDLPDRLTDEAFTNLHVAHNVRVERIVSRGQASPPGLWYDQDEHEWILLLRGRATLEFEHEGRLVELRPGSHMHLPAHCRHRVAWTDPDQDTVWLAVHYNE